MTLLPFLYPITDYTTLRRFATLQVEDPEFRVVAKARAVDVWADSVHCLTVTRNAIHVHYDINTRPYNLVGAFTGLRSSEMRDRLYIEGPDGWYESKGFVWQPGLVRGTRVLTHAAWRALEEVALQTIRWRAEHSTGTPCSSPCQTCGTMRESRLLRHVQDKHYHAPSREFVHRAVHALAPDPDTVLVRWTLTGDATPCYTYAEQYLTQLAEEVR